MDESINPLSLQQNASKALSIAIHYYPEYWFVLKASGILDGFPIKDKSIATSQEEIHGEIELMKAESFPGWVFIKFNRGNSDKSPSVLRKLT